MKALLLCTDFPPAVGGIQTMLGSLASELGDWDLTVVAPTDRRAREFDRQQPYRIVRAPGMGRTPCARHFLPGLTAQAVRLVLRQRPDVILCGHPALSPLGPLLRTLTGIPYVVFTYGMELRHRLLRPLLPRVFANASGIVTISRWTTREVLAQGCPAQRIRQLPLGFDPHRFQALTPSRLPHDLGLVGRPWLLTVSRLEDPYKGIDTALRALPLIAEQVPDVRYVVAGDGRLRQSLQEQAERLGCRERVLFLGRVSDPDLAALYAHCTAFMLMSRDRETDGGAEGFGLVFLEANSFGKPVLGGDSGGIPDAVVDGTTGLLTDPECVPHVAAHAIRLLTDDAFAARLGRQGQERVMRELTWAASARRLQEIVETALGKVCYGPPADCLH